MSKVEALKIITIDEDEKLLRTPSKAIPIDEIKTDEFQNFIEQMHESIRTSALQTGWEAAGLSGVQVGVPKRIFLALDVNSEERGFKEYINPKIKFLGNATEIGLEGCLSIPDLSGKVSRHKRVRLTYYDREGNKQKKDFSGFNSKIIQHEFDHLEGILFIDKLV